MTIMAVVGDVKTRTLIHMYWRYGWRRRKYCDRNIHTSTRDSYQATWPHIPEEVYPHIYFCDKLKPR